MLVRNYEIDPRFMNVEYSWLCLHPPHLNNAIVRKIACANKQMQQFELCELQMNGQQQQQQQ